jgi:PAS domain S-box-containing protein
LDARKKPDSVEGLRERLHRLETALEVTGLGLWEWDVRTGDLVWNARNYELFGVAPRRPVTIQDYAELVHPDDREIVRQTYRRAADSANDDDFVMEHRVAFQPEGKTRWVQARGRLLKDDAGVRCVVGSTLDITDRKTAEERRSLVLRELAHRAKNGILVMMAIVAQTARGAATVPEFEALLTSRLRSMADSQDLVTEAAGRSLPFPDLLGRALTPFDTQRFDVDPQLGEISIPSEMVVAMALLLHELSTNAVKYGALSAPSGRVKLNLAKADPGRAVVAWTELGGPPVKPLTKKGFGTRLLEISLRNNGGHVEGSFEPQGFQARIHFPTSRI